MRTTLDIDDRIMVAAKKAAVEQGITLTQLVEESLHAKLTASATPSDYRFKWKVTRGKLLPGVDISNRDFRRFDGIKVVHLD